MNLVVLTGRVVTPPAFKEGTRPDGSGWVRAYFRLAVYRPLSRKRREGAREAGERTADFFHVVALGDPGDPKDAVAFVRNRAAEGGLEIGTPLEVVGELEQQSVGVLRQREGRGTESGADRNAPETVVVRARRIQYGQGGRSWSPDPGGRDRREEGGRHGRRGGHEGRDPREEGDLREGGVFPAATSEWEDCTTEWEVSHGWAGIRNPFEDDPGDGLDEPGDDSGGGRTAAGGWGDHKDVNAPAP